METNTKKYFIYAVGEVFLIVVGILIAFNLNSWNESRKKEIEFKDLLQQVYNIVKADTESQKTDIYSNRSQLNIIEKFLKEPDSIPSDKLLQMLFYLDTKPQFQSGLEGMQNLLQFKAMNHIQAELLGQIYSYNLNTFSPNNSNQSIHREFISPLLSNANIAMRESIFGLSENDDFPNVFAFNDVSFSIDEYDIRAAREMIPTREFRAALKSSASSKRLFHRFITNGLEDGLSLLKHIEDYYPDVQLLYDDLGIIGDALPSGWLGDSTPMTRKVGEKSVWEIDIHLSDGSLKFRNRNSWNHNWGGRDFPFGESLYFGPNIPVSEGNYRIVLNLNEGNYEFIRMDD